MADYADDHELDGQRAVDALCLVYGSNPARFSGYVGKDLPKARAAMCPFEYRQELRSWRRLLSFWLSDQGGLRPESPPAAALVLTS
jgi:Putative metallopeptidase